MRLKSGLFLLIVAGLAVVGCNKDTAAPEDDAFQKQLAAAAAKHPSAPSGRNLKAPAPGTDAGKSPADAGKATP